MLVAGHWYPAVQSEHIEAFSCRLKVPFAHTVHAVCPVPEKLPAAHATTFVPLFTHSNPAGHTRQAVAFSSSMYFPASHVLHRVAPQLSP